MVGKDKIREKRIQRHDTSQKLDEALTEGEQIRLYVKRHITLTFLPYSMESTCM